MTSAQPAGARERAADRVRVPDEPPVNGTDWAASGWPHDLCWKGPLADDHTLHHDEAQTGRQDRPGAGRTVADQALAQTEYLLAGKHVAITGASRGIGAACALACATAGAGRVALIARSEPQLHELAAQLKRTGARPSVHPCDVTDTDLLVQTIANLRPLDVLVNCAGANQPEPLLDVQPSTLEKLWRLNVQAAFFAAQTAAIGMVHHHKPGVIINISSQMGHVGAPLRAVYCATKHALEGLTKAMAVELAPHDIRVVSVAPTFIHTAMTAAQLDHPDTRDRLLAEIPLGRFGSPQDVADAVIFAASRKARLLTGTSLIIDGGWTAK